MNQEHLVYKQKHMLKSGAPPDNLRGTDHLISGRGAGISWKNVSLSRGAKNITKFLSTFPQYKDLQITQ